MSSPSGSPRELFITYQRETVFVLDWSNFSLPEMKESMPRVRKMVADYHRSTGKKVLWMVDVTNVKFEVSMTQAIVGFMKENKPDVGRFATVGMSHSIRSLVGIVKNLIGVSTLSLFEDRETALKWLTRPRGKGHTH